MREISAMENKLWNSLGSILEAVKESGEEKLNRLIRKNDAWPDIFSNVDYFDRSNSTITLKHSVTLSDFPSIETCHERSQHRSLDRPVVILIFNRTRYVVDGNTRINSYRKSRPDQIFDVIEICPHKIL